jgi:S1-C subfamily serine protease
VITHLNNQAVEDTQALNQILSRHPQGERLTVWVLRNGQERAFRLWPAGRPTVQGRASRDRAEESFRGTTRPRTALGVVLQAPMTTADQQGMVIQRVLPNSPAARAGLRRGDVLTRIDSRPVDDYESLVNILSRHQAGDRLTFGVLRNGQERILRILLSEGTVSSTQETEPFPRERRSYYPSGRFGDSPGGGRYGQLSAEQEPAYLGALTVDVQELTERLRQRLGIQSQEGVVVVDVLPGSPASRAGLRHGDVIVSANDREITDPRELCQAIHETGVGEDLAMQVMRGKQLREIDAHLQEAPVDLLVVITEPMSGPGPEREPEQGIRARRTEPRR